MTNSIQEDLHRFAATLLERRGALVDWPQGAEEGSAVVPPEVAQSLHLDDEVVQLSSKPGGPGLAVSLGADFLDAAGRLLEAEPRIGYFRVPELYLKRGKLDDAVGRAFTWLNAKVSLADTRPVPVEYHAWWFLATIVSEDRWETELFVTINSLSGIEVKLPDPLSLLEIEARSSAKATAPSTYDRAAAAAQARVKSVAADFIHRMEARLQRDRKRLRDYYNALVREAKNKKPRGQAQPDPEKLEAQNRAVQLELRRKLGELDERYAMEVTIEPVALVRAEIPALAVDLSVLRKQARRKHTIYWNPLLKEFEPILCSRCGTGTFGVAFTNEQVDPLCAACAG